MNKIHEKFLCEIWKRQNFIKEIFTSDGQKIIIIDTGQENKELGGPDFKNARIKIGNITFCGDVEIDSTHSDWKNHGHNINKKYNKVILHAVLDKNSHNSFVYTQEGRKVQSVSLEDFLQDDIKKNIRKAIQSEKNHRINKMPCFEINSLINEQEKLDFLHELGTLRFKRKCEKMLERLKELIYLKELKLKEPVIKYELDEKFYSRNFLPKEFRDKEIWMQLIYESVFEALGYSKNKEIMQKVSKAVDIGFFNKYSHKEDFNIYVESILFNIAGLMPEVDKIADEETSAYIKKITQYWTEIKGEYDGRCFSLAQWHFFKLRPQNFPTIRLSGGARIINRLLKGNLIGKIITSVENINAIPRLCNELRNLVVVRGDGFWKRHFIFDQPAKTEINYFIGISRADEIIVNVILPALAIYFEIFDRKELTKKVYKLYQNFFQKTENKLVEEVSSTLQLADAGNRSILYQGMIELFRNYCSREKCLECIIGKKVFN
jgi:hypothetical protein